MNVNARPEPRRTQAERTAATRARLLVAGRTLFADRNPIRTRGPMQVNVAFAEQFSGVAPYPYPVKVSIEDDLAITYRRAG